jgi:hypothetical protein
MDESFQLRNGRPTGESQPAPLDFSMLSAALIAQQTATPAARAQARFDRIAAPRPETDLLIDTVLASPGGSEGAPRLGCFNRATSGRRLNSA